MVLSGIVARYLNRKSDEGEGRLQTLNFLYYMLSVYAFR